MTFKYYLDNKTSIPETLRKRVQDGPADDGVCFVTVPAVDVGLQDAGGRVDCVTFWNKTWVWVYLPGICHFFSSWKTEISVIKISKYLDSEYSILQRHVILLGVAER